MRRRSVLVIAALVAGCGPPDRQAEPAAQRPAAVVWAVGDLDARSDAARPLVETIRRDDPDRVLYTGDVYETGTRSDFARNFDAAYAALASRTWPTPGNHEWRNRRDGYFPYWRRAHGRAIPRWYRRRVGGWDVLSLNTQAPMSRGSRQHRWLRAQLERIDGCLIAFWHRPRFSAGTEAGHGDQPDVAPLWRAVRSRATLIVSGHDHNLQRLRPIQGVVWFVSGAGGRTPLDPIDAADPRLAFAEDGEHGALRLELYRRHLRHRFVDQDGNALDRGRIDCRSPIEG